jgi:hypothetical protein
MSLKSTKEEHVAGPCRKGQGVDSRAPREHSADRPWRLLGGQGVSAPLPENSSCPSCDTHSSSGSRRRAGNAELRSRASFGVADKQRWLCRVLISSRTSRVTEGNDDGVRASKRRRRSCCEERGRASRPQRAAKATASIEKPALVGVGVRVRRHDLHEADRAVD